MPMTIGNTFCLSSPLLKVEEEAIVTQNQGIISILGSDTIQPKTASTNSSFRRTLSADMSPAKLLSQNGFSFALASSLTPMKKIASVEEHAIAVPEKEEEEEKERPGQDDVWRFIQSQKKKVDEKPEGQADVWGSILAQKDKEDRSKSSSSSSEPYVPSVMKRSTSCLDKKSLEICTESLGSETGSDVFSSRAPSESGDAEEESDLKEAVHQVVPKYNFSINKKSSSSRSFPPPLPSLPRPDAPSLFMKPHRENGRLVLQAVPIPSQKCFHAARQDGRLLLKFADDSNPDGDYQKEENEEQLFENFELEGDYQSLLGDETDEPETEEEDDDAEEEEEMEKETMIVMEQGRERYSCEVTNVHRSAILMKKLMRLDDRKSQWNTTQNFNISLNSKVVKSAQEEFDHPLPQSLPWTPAVATLMPTPLPTAATSFNAYDYFWRAKSTAAASAVNSTNIKEYPDFEKKLNKIQLSNNLRENRADYMLPLLKGCKEEPRRSHLAREPHCIATS